MATNTIPFFEVSVESHISGQDSGGDNDGNEKIIVADDTKDFEDAIQLIKNNGGGRLIVKTGQYYIRPINLTSHMILYLEQGTTISAIANESLWPVIPPLPSYGQGRDHPGPRYTSLIHGEYLTNITIQGASSPSPSSSPDSISVLDGQGAYWWTLRELNQDKYTRGHLIEFLYSRQINIWNVHLKDSPFWTNHLFDCDDVHYKGVTITAPQSGAPNTDGWDPDSSRNVLIEDSSYFGGDDCVAIKAGWDCFGIDYGKPTVNVTIRNVTCHGNVAGIAIGSEMSGGVENVTVENITFTMANHVGNIKVGNTRGGYVRNVVFQNITTVGKLKSGIHVDMFHFYNNPNPSCPRGWQPETLPQISNILFDNINCLQSRIQSNETFHFVGMKESPIRGVVLRNVHFPPSEASVGATPWNCSGVSGVALNGTVEPWPPCPQFAIVNDGSDDEMLLDKTPESSSTWGNQSLLWRGRLNDDGGRLYVTAMLVTAAMLTSVVYIRRRINRRRAALQEW